VHPDFVGGLRRVLNAWDPIGVADAVNDGYDCVVGPLLHHLHDGARADKIADFLWRELRDRFGLDPVRYDVDTLADHVVAWWVAAHEFS
jgi:hypothetical protein